MEGVPTDWTRPDGHNYEGQWKAGKREGQGAATSPDGFSYEGQWKAGLPEGQGVETHPDGRRYEGQWKAGKQEGQGIHTFPDGASWEGLWHGGDTSAPGTWRFADGLYKRGEGPSVAERAQPAAPAKWLAAAETLHWRLTLLLCLGRQRRVEGAPPPPTVPPSDVLLRIAALPEELWAPVVKCVM